MDPSVQRIKPGSKIRDDPILFPVAVARGLRTFLAAQLRRKGLFGLCRATDISFGVRPLTGLADAAGDFLGG